MSRRRLTDDEHALWQGVARSVSPLRKRPRRPAVSEPPETTKTLPKPPPKSAPKVRAASAAKSAPVTPPPKLAGPAPLGRKLKQRIARGSHAIDGRLDLHGFTQAEAHGALLHFLRTRQARGAKVVLVITGKGVRGDAGERGVLRRMVPMWFGLAEFRSYVVGFEYASIAHGGEGALYVTLRRLRGE
jgi:DNA-nicking Smr family endonuclease